MKLVSLKGSEFDFDRIDPQLQGYLLGVKFDTVPIQVLFRSKGKIDESVHLIEDPEERTRAYLTAVDTLIEPLKHDLLELGVSEEDLYCFHLTKALQAKVPFPIIAAMSKKDTVETIRLSRLV